MERSLREGRGKRKPDSLAVILDAEAEHNAKRVKRVKSPKHKFEATSKVTSSKKSSPTATPPHPALTPAQAAQAEAKSAVLAKKAVVKKVKHDQKIAKILAKITAKLDKKAEAAAAEKAFIQPYLNQAQDCFDGSGGGRITSSRAKSEYRLNDDDLSVLAYEEKTNPHYKSSAPMRLYEVEEVAQVCEDKYQTIEALARKFAMRDNRRG